MGSASRIAFSGGKKPPFVTPRVMLGAGRMLVPVSTPELAVCSYPQFGTDHSVDFFRCICLPVANECRLRPFVEYTVV